MKLVITALITLFHLSFICQTFLSPSEDLIRKKHVKKITSFYQDSIKKDVSAVWDYDSTGNLIQHWESGTTMIYYLYENKLLKSTISISGGNYGRQIDTVFFLYDSRKRLLEQTTKKYMPRGENAYSYWVPASLKRYHYEYPRENMTIRKVENFEDDNDHLSSKPEIYYDTLLYDIHKLLLSETYVLYDRKTSYLYNSRQQLVQKTLTIKQKWVVRYTFTYKDGRLIREEECNNYEKGKCDQKIIWDYNYNESGLIKSIKSRLYSLHYEYEYY